MPTHHDVHLHVPAESAYVSVIRTTTAGLAARVDFTLDDIEDLRIAVGEACAMVLAQSSAGADLRADFDLGERELTVRVSGDVEDPQEPDHSSFAWQVLTALTTSTASAVDGREVSVTLTMHSTAD